MASVHKLVDSATEGTPSEPTTKPQATPEIPDKFKGKTMEDIVRSYQELEKSYGMQGKELGEVRKLASELLSTKAESSNSVSETSPTKEEETSIFDAKDPDAYLRKVIEDTVKRSIQPLTKSMANSQQAQTVAKLNQNFPEWQNTVASPEFQQWVGRSKVRQELFQKANDTYDYDGAAELFDMYDTYNKAQSVKESEKKQKLKAAKTESGTTGQLSSDKVFRRHELQQLMMTDRAKYDAMQDEILAAYREGRVK